MGAKWSQHRGVDQIHLITYVHKPVVFRSIRKQYPDHIYIHLKAGLRLRKSILGDKTVNKQYFHLDQQNSWIWSQIILVIPDMLKNISFKIYSFFQNVIFRHIVYYTYMDMGRQCIVFLKYHFQTQCILYLHGQGAVLHATDSEKN